MLRLSPSRPARSVSEGHRSSNVVREAADDHQSAPGAVFEERKSNKLHMRTSGDAVTLLAKCRVWIFNSVHCSEADCQTFLASRLRNLCPCLLPRCTNELASTRPGTHFNSPDPRHTARGDRLSGATGFPALALARPGATGSPAVALGGERGS